MKRIFLTAALSIALAAAGSAQQRQALTPEQRQQKLAEARQLLQQRQEKLGELQQQLQEFEVQLQQQQQQSRQLQRETQHLQTRHRQYHCATGFIVPINRTVQNAAATTANAPPAVGAELRQQTQEVQIQVTRHSQSLSDIGGLLANLKGTSGGISSSGNPLGTNVASLSDLGMTQQEQQQVLTIQHQLQQQNQQNMVFQQQIQQESLRYQTLGHAQRGMHDIIAQMLSNLK